MNRRNAKTDTAGRSCQNCGACCITMAIKELDSEPGNRPSCLKNYIGGGGRCGRYDDQPNECAVFECGWLQGIFEDRHRPDRSGVIVHDSGTDEEPAVGMIETRPGALNGPLGREMREIARLRGIAIIKVLYGDVPRLGTGWAMPITIEGTQDQVIKMGRRAAEAAKEMGKLP